MNLNDAVAKALQKIRLTQGLTQEDFSDVSSRTYISTLERGLKSPTIEKLDLIARTLGVSPVTLIVFAYSINEDMSTEELLSFVTAELNQLGLA